MSAEDLILLNKVFTKKSVLQLIRNERVECYSRSIEKFICNDQIKTNRQIFTELYKIMKMRYRNEYFYKNTLINKLLLGTHSMNTSAVLSEVLIGKSKADFLIINESIEIYEIKTELDNLDRLPYQIEDYYKVFPKVSVITSEDNYYKVFKMFKDSKIGIKILTQRGTINVKKESDVDYTFLSYKEIFKILRKKEFELILLDYFSELPEVNQFDYYMKCLRQFSLIPMDYIQKKIAIILKERNSVSREHYEMLVPYEFKGIVYFANFSIEEIEKLDIFLKKERR